MGGCPLTPSILGILYFYNRGDMMLCHDEDEKATLIKACALCWEYSQMRTLQAQITMYPEGEGVCETHQEDQKFFCEISNALLCVTCSKLEDHVSHVHWPIAVAAFRYRKLIPKYIKIISFQVKEIQRLHLKEEEPLAWAVVRTNYKYKSSKNFETNIQELWEYFLQKKIETLEMKELELIVGKENEKLSELYQKLKEVEAIWECDIMKQKMEWEAMVSREITFLTDKVRELEEMSQKSNVELLKDVIHRHERIFINSHLKPFIPHINQLYVSVVNEFLEFFQTFEQSSPWISYNLPEEGEKKRTVTFLRGFSGDTFIYNTGNFHADRVRIRAFSSNDWCQSSLIERKHCPIIRTRIDFSFN
ncbi:tripartite motif-containing protein 15-like [Gracilinanus agilis]|uniref:tripartite motif-containing protein 15-like n=1 Tax=Gracilinanus agilis TaxID=191870 RepID=UPI001CFDC0AA|nr:tripartite motif-containing protein 15-like [Gracilinanus agilis]